MKKYEFTFELETDEFDGVAASSVKFDENFDALANKVYAAVNGQLHVIDDVLVSSRNSIIHLDICQEAESLEKAIASALEQMRKIDLKVSNIQIDPKCFEKKKIMDVVTGMNISSKGTVMIGKLLEDIHIGDKITIIGDGKSIPSAIMGIETFSKSFESATAGMEVGLLLRGVLNEFVFVDSKPPYDIRIEFPYA